MGRARILTCQLGSDTNLRVIVDSCGRAKSGAFQIEFGGKK